MMKTTLVVEQGSNTADTWQKWPGAAKHQVQMDFFVPLVQ